MCVIGSARAVTSAVLRLVYSEPVAVAPITTIQISKLRGGFMDVIEESSAILEQKSHGRLKQAVSKLQFRK